MSLWLGRACDLDLDHTTYILNANIKARDFLQVASCSVNWIDDACLSWLVVWQWQVASSSRLVIRPISFITKSISPELDVPTRSDMNSTSASTAPRCTSYITSLIIPHARPWQRRLFSVFRRAGGERLPARYLHGFNDYHTAPLPKYQLSRAQMLYVWDYIRKQSALDSIFHSVKKL
jgi:hypothetical protein